MEEANVGNYSLSPKNLKQTEHGLKSKGMENGSTETNHGWANSGVSQCPAETRPNMGELERGRVSAKNSIRLSRYGKKIAMRNRGKKYLLRSSFSSSRVLRSMSKTANATPPTLNNNPVNHVKERNKKGRKKAWRASNDEFSRIRRSVRYLLHRMSYEQSLIDAYAGEGWKGQSAEKIKPEMELQRAKSEISRCKLKIRNLFQQLDSSISEGKLDDSLFDSGGEICSEDIFCAKCISKDVSAENDIILCDGICDRGFHQKCLDPPLLKDDIPPGDEGWLCPGCDCKVDCLDLINETQGAELSIEDEWEKVFPEAAAFASKNGQHDDLELPSDDSEDYDYDPDSVEVDEEPKNESSSDESDFTSASEDLGPPNPDLQDQNFGFPSDDSEDIDYDPDKPDLDKKATEDSSYSDESNFTSDTDDLNISNDDASDANKVTVSPVSKFPSSFSHSGKGSDAGATDKLLDISVPCPLESELGQDWVAPQSGKRQREHLDYKKLYDDAYGNNSSDSSDDEEWTELSTPKNSKYDAAQEDTKGLIENNVEPAVNQRRSKHVKGKQDVPDKIVYGVCAGKKGSSQKRKTCREDESTLASYSVDILNQDFTQPYSDENNASRYSNYGAAAFQKLQESFRENQYPSRESKERLGTELGMTSKQVGKWFDKARRSFRVSAKAASPGGPSSVSATTCGKTSNNNINSQKLQESFSENQYPNREAKESLARELKMTVQQVSKWFDNTRHKFRVSTIEVSPAGPGAASATSCSETSNDNVSAPETVGSKRPSKGRQPQNVGESHNVSKSEIQNSKNGSTKMNKRTQGTTMRDILVMRELRKRRMSK